MKDVFIEKDDFLYQQVAERIEKLIGDRVLGAGDKLLSVRMLSKEQGISMSTAFQAYSFLENKGIIEARPKSGYYVRFIPEELHHLPQQDVTLEEARRVSVDETITAIHKNLTNDSIIQFSCAAPSLELLPQAKLNKAMMYALRHSKGSCLPYENIQGNEFLRKQIARFAFNWGGSVNEDDIVITAGCMEAMAFALRAVTKPGDTVAIECPTYFGIFHAMQNLGLNVLEIPTDPEHGVNLEYLAKAIDKFRIKACLFVTNFNNPIGSCMSDEKKKQLVDLLARHEIPLIEDDIYGEMYFGKKRPRTCKTFDKKGLVLLCSSVSKSLAPGYRVGWVIPGRFKEKVMKLKLVQNISTASPTQAAIAQFMEAGRFELHLRKLRKSLHTQCLRYLHAIADYFPAGTKVTRPQGGYVLWIALNKKINALDVYQQAIKHNISIVPGQVYSTDARFINYIRISFGRPYDSEVERGIKTLGQLIKRMM